MNFRFNRAVYRAAFLGSLVAGVVGEANALLITPTYDSTITSDANAAQIEATIQNAINVFQTTFTDPVTVNIKFQEGGGLGGSSTWIFDDTYSNFRTHLISDATSALDASAIGSLAATNPFPNKNVMMTTAGARAIGYSTSPTPDGFDSTITLNTSFCFFRTGVVAGEYDLQAVAMHEIDEALGGGGSGSFIGSGFASTDVGTTDLFRYSAAGVRTGLVPGTSGEYMSVDGGVTAIRNFGDGAGGSDEGDWANGGVNHVQDAFGTPGVIVNYSPEETKMMDAIGWNVKQAVPEPCTIALLGLGLPMLLRRRRSRA